MIRFDPHVHTILSYDGLITEVMLEKFFSKFSDFILAITDHNEIKKALSLKKIFFDQIIIGEEIRSSCGEIIGLFLEKEVKAGMSPKETVRAIKEQGGIVMIPHPFDSLRDESMQSMVLDEIVDFVDIIEVFNARTLREGDNEKASSYCKIKNKIPIVGSDAHAYYELGRTYVEMEEFQDQNDFMRKIKSAKFVKNRLNLTKRLRTKIGRGLKTWRVF